MELFEIFSKFIGGLYIGGLCGLIPLIIGIVRKKVIFGIIGECVCVVFGILMTMVFLQPAFLSIIPSALCTVFIFVYSAALKKREK